MFLVEFFFLDLEQDSYIQVVYKVDELIDIFSGVVFMCLVGKVYLSWVIVFFDEIYLLGFDIGEEMFNYEGEEVGVLVDGCLELIVGSEIYVFECGDSYYFESNKLYCFCNFYDVLVCLISVIMFVNF